MVTAEAAPLIRVRPPGPRASAVLAADLRLFGRWPSRPYPLVVSSSDGVLVHDVDGNSFLDMNGLLGVNVLGHANPEIARAVSAQVARGGNVGFCDHADPLPGRVAERLLALLPGFDHVMFANSGGEAVDWALRLARGFRGRDLVVGLRGSYHGGTTAAWQASGVAGTRHLEALRPDVIHVDPEELDPAVLGRRIDLRRVAAVLLEPIVGASVRPLPTSVTGAVAALQRNEGVLLIADEIQTGGFRTGPFLASPTFGLEPDLVTLSKAISGGLPFAVVCLRDGRHLFEHGGHGSTYGANLVACAAALAALEELETLGAEARATSIGVALQALLANELDGSRGVGEIRGRGALWGIELAAGIDPKRVATRIFERGVLTLAGDAVIRLLPPYVMTDRHLATAVRLIGEGIRDAVREL